MTQIHPFTEVLVISGVTGCFSLESNVIITLVFNAPSHQIKVGNTVFLCAAAAFLHMHSPDGTDVITCDPSPLLQQRPVLWCLWTPAVRDSGINGRALSMTCFSDWVVMSRGK